jgi:hypothetical protein
LLIVLLQYITSDIKPQPESDSDDSQPLPAVGHGELLETILDEDPATIITDMPEASVTFFL